MSMAESPQMSDNEQDGIGEEEYDEDGQYNDPDDYLYSEDDVNDTEEDVGYHSGATGTRMLSEEDQEPFATPRSQSSQLSQRSYRDDAVGTASNNRPGTRGTQEVNVTDVSDDFERHSYYNESVEGESFAESEYERQQTEKNK